MQPWLGLAVRTCVRCTADVYMDTLQPVPLAMASVPLICAKCAWADPEMRPQVIEMYTKVRAASSIG